MPVLPFVSTERTIILQLCVSLGGYANSGGCSDRRTSIKIVEATRPPNRIESKKISAHPLVAEILMDTVFIQVRNDRLSKSIRLPVIHSVSL